MFFPKVFSGARTNRQASSQEDKKAAVYRSMLRREAAIGGSLFGTIPAGGRREFFCLDESTWIWHEEWIDAAGQRQVRNTRYDVRPNAILKAQNGQGYQMVSHDEAKNLQSAIRMYVARVKKDLYADVV